MMLIKMPLNFAIRWKVNLETSFSGKEGRKQQEGKGSLREWHSGE